METITMSVTYLYKHFYEVMNRVINREIIVDIKYKGKICATLQPHNINV